MKAEISSHYKRFNMRISIWQLIKFQPINARLVKNLGGPFILERFANRQLARTSYFSIAYLTYLILFVFRALSHWVVSFRYLSPFSCLLQLCFSSTW